MEINQYDITMATHYDITIGNDVARDAHCEITMGNNDVARNIHCDGTMGNDIDVCTYHDNAYTQKRFYNITVVLVVI